ncbi:hypothetical protein EXT57_15095 [Pectobacterium brasiliense]|uniref:hypothetical protein n=1 Tax=Pectobacterium brasiliense TaxID=180957 RepID=UPI00202D257E|nr:hypothetical protein [Pectobacterium brasiliense]MCL6378670.1 hypothetical protein [Pectobacterium brasiliense]
MKPSQLNPGMRVLLKPVNGHGQSESATVVCHVPAIAARPAYTTIRRDSYAKLSLPDDVGCVHLLDADIAWRVNPMEQQV